MYNLEERLHLVTVVKTHYQFWITDEPFMTESNFVSYRMWNTFLGIVIL